MSSIYNRTCFFRYLYSCLWWRTKNWWFQGGRIASMLLLDFSSLQREGKNTVTISCVCMHWRDVIITSLSSLNGCVSLQLEHVKILYKQIQAPYDCPCACPNYKHHRITYVRPLLLLCIIQISVTVRLSLMERHKSYWTRVCFWYCRTYYSGGSWHKPQNSHAALLDKYWTKLQIGNMTREELKKVSAPYQTKDKVRFFTVKTTNMFNEPIALLIMQI